MFPHCSCSQDALRAGDARRARCASHGRPMARTAPIIFISAVRRMHYALETHGVRAVRMAPTPAPAQLKPPQPLLSSSAGAFVVKWSPYALVGLVYLATSYVRWKKVRRAVCLVVAPLCCYNCCSL